MNTRQRRILVAAAIIVVAMLLSPPVDRFIMGDHYLNYRWLFDRWEGTIVVWLLLVQWFTVGIVAAIAYFVYADKKE